MDYTIWIIVGIVVLIGLWLWSTYNGLVTLNERVEEAASQLVAALADLQGDHGHTRPWRELSADLDAFCASAWAGASCMQPF